MAEGLNMFNTAANMIRVEYKHLLNISSFNIAARKEVS